MKHTKSIDFSGLMEEYYASGTQQDIIKYINKAFQEIRVVCPNCKNQMLQVHYDFEVPAQHDLKSWKNLQENMSSKTVIQYGTYIHWHQLELQKVAENSITFKELQLNLEKLVFESKM
ncbi:hypothetical protein [Lacinutrix jangbogonensis]|uniref:hypothetical protein n=1 Tax=Lacinutrix jangbogonensis TaxID=1469557 RepID=UPI0012E03D7C|nr:hypothetical protein [Lacinutrix jangbogonensis]